MQPYYTPKPIDRLRILAEANSSRDAQLNFVARCKDYDGTPNTGPVYFINNCVDTMNPQLPPSQREQMMLLTLRQVECVHHIHNSIKGKYDSVELKSRKVGGSWLYMAYLAWGWLFEEHFTAVLGSYVENMVEAKGGTDTASNMNALLPKWDYIIRRLPVFMQVAGYEAKAPHKVDFIRLHPHNGSAITGEAITPNFGAGARGGIAILDELSRAANQNAGWTSCGQTVVSRHAIGTPQGKDLFWGLAFPEDYALLHGLKNVEHPEVFRLLWKDMDINTGGNGPMNEYWVLPYHVERGQDWKGAKDFDAFLARVKGDVMLKANGYSPLDDDLPAGMGYENENGEIPQYRDRKPHDSLPAGAECVIYPNYERERLKYKDEDADRELDISFESKRKGRVYSIQFSKTPRRRILERDARFPLYASCDPGRGKGNAFAVLWTQFNYDTGKYEWLREYIREGYTARHFRALLSGTLSDYAIAEAEDDVDAEFQELFDEMQERQWRPDLVTGDPNAMIVKTATSKFGVREIFRESGLTVTLRNVFNEFDKRIEAARNMLGYCEICPKGCPKLITAIQETAYREHKPGSQQMTEEKGYVHDPKHSHPMAAFEYLSQLNPNRLDIKAASNLLSARGESPMVQAYQAPVPKSVLDELYDNRGGGDNRRRISGY